MPILSPYRNTPIDSDHSDDQIQILGKGFNVRFDFLNLFVHFGQLRTFLIVIRTFWVDMITLSSSLIKPYRIFPRTDSDPAFPCQMLIGEITGIVTTKTHPITIDKGSVNTNILRT